MRYLIAGKILSVFTLFLFKQLTSLEYFELKLYEVIIGWFLIESVYEEYLVTASNLFFTLIDFRNLISNFVLVFHEIVVNKIIILFFKCTFLLLSLLLLGYFLVSNRLSFYINLFFTFYVYSLICYFLDVGLYWTNIVIFFYLFFNFDVNQILTKLNLWLICILVLFGCLFKLLLVENLCMNNFLQENLIKLLFIYSYMYYLNRNKNANY